MMIQKKFTWWSLKQVYLQRPANLENVSLLSCHWAALYDSCQKQFMKKSKTIDRDNNDDELLDCADKAKRPEKQKYAKQH